MLAQARSLTIFKDRLHGVLEYEVGPEGACD